VSDIPSFIGVSVDMFDFVSSSSIVVVVPSIYIHIVGVSVVKLTLFDFVSSPWWWISGYNRNMRGIGLNNKNSTTHENIYI
jgi:hypothetical protein